MEKNKSYSANVIGELGKHADYGISCARFIATNMIILCHIFQYYCHPLFYWFNAAVQMFFFLSGLLYANKTIDDPVQYIIGRFKRILVPYYIFVIIASVIGLLFAGNECTIKDVLFLMVLKVDGNYIALHNLWFVSHILLFYIMTPLMLQWMDYLQNRRTVERLFGVFLTITGMFFFFSIFADFYKTYGILCYFLGVVYGRFSVCCNKNIIKVLNCMVVFCMTFSCILQGIVEVKWLDYVRELGGEKIYSAWYFINHILLGVGLVIVFVSIYKVLEIKLNLGRWSHKILNFSDKYSYDIYLVHQIFILGAFSIYHMIDNVILATILIFFFTGIAAMSLHFLSDKVLEKIK